jgi:outer membrane protein OmpA-like peptidoglycan-associated protein
VLNNIKFVRYFLLLVLFLLRPCVSFAQEVTIINNFPNSSPKEAAEGHVLKKVTQHTYIVNEYEPLQNSPRAQAMQMISYNLRAYTDRQYSNSSLLISALEAGKPFAEAAAGIVRNALWINDMQFHDDFTGFSLGVVQLAQSLYEVKGFGLAAKENTGLSRSSRQIELYLFQRMVYDLKVSMEHEVTQFLDVELLPGLARSEATSGMPAGDVSPLELLDVRMAPLDESSEDFSALRPSFPVDYGSAVKTEKPGRSARKSQAANSALMVELLQENNKILSNYGSRFEDIQGQIDQEREQRNEGMELVREEVRALRDLVKATLTNRVGTQVNPAGAAGAALAVDLIFEKNMHALSPAHHATLNRIELAMIQNPNFTANITGFADRSGDADYNAILSEKRASAVQAYLADKGIEPSRMQLTYVGDAASEFANPADRKVEVSLR